MAKIKYYVVWKGRKTGIFNTWEACAAQVTGYKDAEYKAFDSLPAAQAALAGAYVDFKGKPAAATQSWLFARTRPLLPSLSVDAACSGAPGPLEYRGVETESGKAVFKAGPYRDGTNNVGEFLAIVRALAWLKEHRHDWPVYSDSENAIAWVKAGKARTKLAHTGCNEELFALIAQAEAWLAENGRANKVIKWDTAAWGENPADFGRK
jgi:ribonuclease HI